MMYHAYVSTKSSLLAAAAEFHAMGYEVEMVDFPGSGGSTGNDTTLGYREALDVLATITDAPQPQVGKPLILYGQSMGAAALLRAVGELHAPADGIIIESPYDRLLSTVQVRFQAMHVPAFPLSQLLVFWGGLQHGYWGFGMNPSDFATHIHCPVLMFHGGLDARVTDDEASAVFSNFAGPRQLERFANAPHCAFLSTDPARWETAVRALLSEAIRYAGSMR
jgi:alpha-beta hydrolase superfamily lysophospholipase